MQYDLSQQQLLLKALLKEIEYINSSVSQNDTQEPRELAEIRFKTNLTQLLFPTLSSKEFCLNTKIEESDLKCIEDYFVQLSTTPANLQEFASKYLSCCSVNLSKNQIDRQIKLITEKKSDIHNFISQIYLLKKEELNSKLNELQKFENDLNRTRKSYKLEYDLNKLKEFEDRHAEMTLNYNRHMDYLKLCEQGMMQVTENCFNLAISILREIEPKEDSYLQ